VRQITDESAALPLLHCTDESRYVHHLSQDFDEQAQLLQGWNQDYSQLSAGVFNGFVSNVHLPEVSLFLEFTNQQLYQQGYLDQETAISIGVPMHTMQKGIFCGSPCEQQALHIYSGRAGFEFVSPPNLTIGLIVISRQFLMQHLSDEYQERLHSQWRDARILRLSLQKYLNLVRFLRSVFVTLQTLPGLLHYANLVQETQIMALQMVADALFGEDDTVTTTAHYQHQCWQVVAKTRKIVRLRQDDPISVIELCQCLAMTHRTLQYHFQRAIDKSPVVYLRTERLNAVRQMLKSTRSVTEAATSWGFWHFGHFSQEYKKMFGESPSTTFKRFHC
jgi:AraC family transcriptional regulator, ethanolamine operon transcriptional activator